MSRLFYHVCQDNAGNLLFGVTGTMRIAGSGTLATIYGDEALTIPIANPMTCHPSFASFKCFLGVGDYDFYLAKAGYTFETLTGVQGSGTMADQNASAVAITGGTLSGVTVSGTAIGGTTLIDTTGYGRVDRLGVGVSPVALPSNYSQLSGPTGVQAAPVANVALGMTYNKATQFGQYIKAVGADTGNVTLAFVNVAGTLVGSIDATGSATAFNTTSDARLKFDVETLTGELDLVRALRPVRFKWIADDSPGVGFLAGEVAEHVQGVVSGEADAVDGEGRVVPQQIDLSKLVPYLVGAIKTLTARVAVLEDALGI